MENEKMSFFKKYYISTLNVDNFSKIAVLKDKGRWYLTFLILVFSLILTIISLTTFKPMYIDEIKKMPEFKIEANKIELLENEKTNEKYNKEFSKINFLFLNIYPNMTNRDYINIKDNIRDLKIEEIEKNKDNLLEEYFTKKAKENDLSEEKLKEEIESLDEVPVLILKDGIYLNLSGKRYVPFSQITNEDKVIGKKDILEIFDRDLYKIVSVPFYITAILTLLFITFIMKLVASIYMSLATFIYKTGIFMIPRLRSKISNYGISGPLTLMVILTILSIKNIIQGIDVMLISTLVYIVYLNIITKILLSDVNTMKEIRKLELQTANGLPINEIFDNLEEEAKNKKEKLKELKKEEQETKDENNSEVKENKKEEEN